MVRATLLVLVLTGCEGGLTSQFHVTGVPSELVLVAERTEQSCRVPTAAARVGAVVVPATVDVTVTDQCTFGACVSTRDCGPPVWKLPAITDAAVIDFDDQLFPSIGVMPRVPIAVAPDGSRVAMAAAEPWPHVRVRSGELVSLEIFDGPSCRNIGLASHLSLSVGGVARALQWSGTSLWVEAPGQQGEATFTLEVPSVCITSCERGQCLNESRVISWKLVLDVE